MELEIAPIAVETALLAIATAVPNPNADFEPVPKLFDGVSPSPISILLSDLTSPLAFAPSKSMVMVTFPSEAI